MKKVNRDQRGKGKGMWDGDEEGNEMVTVEEIIAGEKGPSKAPAYRRHHPSTKQNFCRAKSSVNRNNLGLPSPKRHCRRFYTLSLALV